MDKTKELKDFFDERKIKQTDIARDLGVTPIYVNAMLNGRRGIGAKMAKKMSELYGLSVSWLMTGIGSMIDGCCCAESIVSGETIGMTYGDNSPITQKSESVESAVLAKENEMLKEQVEDLKEQVRFLKELAINNR